MVNSPRAAQSATNSDTAYCPDRCDIIWIDFNPQTGREQANRRPAFVLSPRSYNRVTRLCILCPITSQIKGYPFEVELKSGSTTGVILSDQVKSLDWQQRRSDFIENNPDPFPEISGKLKALLGL
ncbi:mRNA interferase MazF [Azorhizobium sp. AG788]|uniref:endoribonuclease MazF n=1 Tax=Azorhizobium sp. AG788 TaxID=2183897 RepID=UPI00105CAABF|nr:endoribonuclease MazF [Azorhizobium sp. AG788]TDU00925.1 mRNA interferase MazF [Azorhizobium sp. AG788]